MADQIEDMIEKIGKHNVCWRIEAICCSGTHPETLRERNNKYSFSVPAGNPIDIPDRTS